MLYKVRRMVKISLKSLDLLTEDLIYQVLKCGVIDWLCVVMVLLHYIANKCNLLSELTRILITQGFQPCWTNCCPTPPGQDRTHQSRPPPRPPPTQMKHPHSVRTTQTLPRMLLKGGKIELLLILTVKMINLIQVQNQRKMKSPLQRKRKK